MKMATFSAYFKKEIMESKRQYRYLVLAVGVLLFAILDPLMLKALPLLMKNQLPVDLGALMVITPKSAVMSYIKDLFQVGSIFIVFTLGGTLCEEIKSQKLVFPYSLGGSPAGITIAKIFHYSITIIALIFLGFMISYYYGGILFTGESAVFSDVMISAFLMSVYFLFNITFTIFLSSLVRKGIAAGFISLALSYIMSSLSSIEGLGRFIPYKLVEGANAFSLEGMTLTIILVLLLCIIFSALTVYRMEKVETI